MLGLESSEPLLCMLWREPPNIRLDLPLGEAAPLSRLCRDLASSTCCLDLPCDVGGESAAACSAWQSAGQGPHSAASGCPERWCGSSSMAALQGWKGVLCWQMALQPPDPLHRLPALSIPRTFTLTQLPQLQV